MWLRDAMLSLKGTARSPLPVGRGRRLAVVDLERSSSDANRLMEMAVALPSYSLVEMGRLLRAEEEQEGVSIDSYRLTDDYVKDLAGTRVAQLERAVDRRGDEPHFLFAAHFAHYLLGLPVGTSEADAIDGFMRDERCAVQYLWPDIELEDFERLRRIYPFIPRWPTGYKTAESLSFNTKNASDDYKQYIEEIRALEMIPMTDRTLETVSALRGERGQMKDVSLFECTGIFSDLVPRLELMIAVDELDGKRVDIVSKHYSTDERVASVVRRVFGAKIETFEGDRELLAASKERVAKMTEAAGPSDTVAVHIEGIKSFWPWFADHKRAHPGVDMIAVSHTSSDGRDLLRNVEGDMPTVFELMCLSEAKIRDERARFKQTFQWLLHEVGDKSHDAIYDRHFLIMGYGNIVGPAMVDALQGKDVKDFVVYDIDPERRAAARAAGLTVIDTLDGEYDRSPFIISCAGDTTLDAEKLARFTGHPTLMSLGSGRYEFDMEYIERESAKTVGLKSRESGQLGHQPIVEYYLPNGTHFTAIADGYVANLAYPRPNIPAYSVTTPLLVWESIRQAKYHLDLAKRAPEGWKRMTPHLLRAVDIDVSNAGVRTIRLLPRGVESMDDSAVQHLLRHSRHDQCKAGPFLIDNVTEADPA
jgi:S-adenosylhomocysteine hydrolase